MSTHKAMTFRPRFATHVVSCVVDNSPARPLPYAEHGTTWIITRLVAEWRRQGINPWKLHVVTASGAASNGSPVARDYFPDNVNKQPPKELSAWIASTHPEVPKGQTL